MRQVLGLRTKTDHRSESYGFLALKTREVEVTSYRWTVDGFDIAEWISRQRQLHDPVTPAQETAWLAGDDADARDRLQRLLGQASPDFGGRTALLTCPICGDLACGAFTAEVVFGESLVTWRALGYDGGSRTEPPALFEPPLQLQFDRDSYSEVLQTALKALGG